MGATVRAYEARAIHREAHRQLLDHHVMYDLVVGALQEGGIDRAERLVALRRHSGREGDGMLLGDSDVEHPFGETFPEDIESRARGHGGRDRDDPGVALGLANQFLRKDGGVARCAALGRSLDSRGDFEFADGMPFVSRPAAGA
jgi:hypothetical protein